MQLCAGLRQTGGTLHLVGLLGPGGVHALDRHLLACVELGIRHKVQSIAIHGFLDGRDSAPTLGAEVVRTLLMDMRRIAGSRVDIATLTGRYYGMDRDRRWERTQSGLRRHGPRPRSPGRASGAGGAGGLPAGRDRRVHSPAGARPQRRAGGDHAGRGRGLLLQLPQRPDAADRGRACGAGIRCLRGAGPAAGYPASR